MQWFATWISVSPELLLLLFMVSILAAFIDSIAGGGGLLTVPVLLACGLTPAQTLATNKLQAAGGSFSASLYFIRRKVVSLREQKLNIACTVAGAMIGSVLIQYINSEILRHILPALLFIIGLWFLLMPNLGLLDNEARLKGPLFALIAGGCVGFYDGFLGPGSGSFYSLAFVTLAGFNLSRATAHAKVLNFTSNITSLCLFIFVGNMVWGCGIVMMLGAIIGARLGARLVISRGRQLIRPLVVAVSMLMCLKLWYDTYSSTLLIWWQYFYGG